ncbi:hypothetical protein PT2222_20338 [Paraburkholderia tropica]
MKAGDREFGAAAQPRLDCRDAHVLARQIGSQVQAELMDERLRRAVHVAARIRVGAGNRPEVEDPAAIAFDHAGEGRVGAIHETLHVRIDHGFPVFQRRAIRWFNAERQAGIVDEYVDAAILMLDIGEELLDCCGVAHVECAGDEPFAAAPGEGLKPVCAPRGCEDTMTFVAQAGTDRLAKTGARARYDNIHSGDNSR